MGGSIETLCRYAIALMTIIMFATIIEQREVMLMINTTTDFINSVVSLFTFTDASLPPHKIYKPLRLRKPHE